jgi:hypothetical protein
VSIPKISVNQNARNVLVTKNILPEGIWNYSDATQAGFSDNYYVQNTVPEKDNFYGKLFINALAYEDADLEDIVAIPGSIIDTGNYGSSKTQPSASTASIVNTSGTGLQLLTHTFSVPGANSVRWEFGDGGTASGNPVTYTYKEPGTYEVEARVEIDGQRKTVKKSIEVLSPVVLDVSFENGSADDKSYLDSDAKLVGSVRVTGGVAVYTGTESNYIQYPRSFARSQNTAFTVSLDVTPTAPFTQGGTILYHSGSYQLGIEPTALSVYLMFPDLPKAVSRSVKYSFVAGQTYRLTYVFEGQTKTFKVFVNGTKVDEFTIEASRHAGSLGHDFLFGNPWRASFPRTIDNLLMLRGALTDAEVATYASTGRLPVFGASVAAPVTPVPTPTPTPTPTEPMQPVDEDFLDPPPTPVEEVEQPEEEVLPPPAPITPITPVTPVTPTPGRIRTTDMLNVRTVPGGSIITMVPMGSQGTVLSAQPIEQGAWSWIQVRFDSGVTGYVATAYTVPLTSENSPSGASAADIRAVQLQQIQQLLQLVLQLQRQLEQLRAQGR